MNPAEAQEKLFPYVDGRTGPADTEAFETAMERDPALRRAVANARFLRDRLARLRDRVNLDPALLDAAPKPVEPKRAKVEKEPAEPRERSIPTSLLAVGLVVVLAGIGALVFLAGNGEEDRVDEGSTQAAKRDPVRVRREKTEAPRPADPEPTKTPDPKPPVRPTAVKPSVEMLIPRLILEPSQIRLEAVWRALTERPERASVIYSRLPTVEKEGQRIALILALAPANREAEVRHRLLTLMKADGSAAVRRAAAAALGHVPGKDHAEVAATRRLSVRAGAIDDPELRVQLLDAAASERDPAVLGTLIRLLGPSRSLDGTIEDRLVELAHSPSAALRAAAIDGLRAGSGGDGSVLDKLIADKAIPAVDRAKLVGTWARRADGKVDLDRLYRLIDGRAADKEVRAAAVRALGGVRTQAVVSKVIVIARDTVQDREVRLAALGVLASAVLKDATRALEGIAATETDETVRNAAKELLRARKRNPEVGEPKDK